MLYYCSIAHFFISVSPDCFTWMLDSTGNIFRDVASDLKQSKVLESLWWRALVLNFLGLRAMDLLMVVSFSSIFDVFLSVVTFSLCVCVASEVRTFSDPFYSVWGLIYRSKCSIFNLSLIARSMFKFGSCTLQIMFEHIFSFDMIWSAKCDLSSSSITIKVIT